MRKIRIIVVFALSFVLFTSCRTTNSLQKELQNFHFDLDYELDSDEYPGAINQTVYLNFIDNSNMEYYTTVTDKSVLILPFILYNYWHKKFYITLGERSLTQPYREFLTDALLAECNRSTCFNLENGDKISVPDSAYVLDVKIIRNETQSGIKEANSFLIIPTYSGTFNFAYSSFQVLPASSELEMTVRLLQGNTCLFEKTYSANQKEKSNERGWDNSLAVNDNCLNNMTLCLAGTTKNIVEDISRSLHLILLSK
jgi:hypothetical protein